MKLDQLDIVFEENELKYLDQIGIKIGQRKKVTDWGIFGKNGRKVVYMDPYGNTTGYAREEGFRDRYVQFYDKNDNPTIRARAYEKLDGRLVVEYIDQHGKVISSRFADKDKIRRNNPHTMDTDPEVTQRGQGGTTGGGGTTGQGLTAEELGGLLKVSFSWLGIFALVIGFIFLSCLLAAVFQEPMIALFHEYATVLQWGRVFCLYSIGPLALLVAILRTRKTFRAAASIKTFEILQILFCAAAMAGVSFLLSKVMVFFPDTVSGWDGAGRYLLGYAPLAAFALLSRILVSFWKKDQKIHALCAGIALRFVNAAVGFGTAGIFLARVIMLFGWYFNPVEPHRYMVRFCWQAVLGLFMAVAVRCLYRDVITGE